MKPRLWLALLLSLSAASAGTLSLVSVTTPNNTAAASGQYTGFGDGAPMNWTGFGATANGAAGTVIMTGVLECVPVSGCGGGAPARFRMDFTGSDFQAVDINFQGALFGTAPPDVYGTLFGTVNTVIFSGTPSIIGNQIVGAPQHQIMSLTTNFGIEQPTDGKVLLTAHESVEGIPAGAFYGWTILTVEVLSGRLDFSDPLTNNFSTAADVPEPGTLPALGLGLAVLAAVRRVFC